MADKSIKLKFEVLGGGSVGGESGQAIHDQLSAIMRELNNKEEVVGLKVRLDKNALSSMKTQIKNAFAEVKIMPGRDSLPRLREEIRRYLKDIPVSFTPTVSTGLKSGKTGGTSQADPALKQEINNLNALIKQYEAAQKKYETSLYGNKAAPNQTAYYQQQASQFEERFNEAIDRVKANTDKAWQEAANNAVSKMEQAKRNIDAKTSEAQSKFLDNVAKAQADAAANYQKYEGLYGADKIQDLKAAYDELGASIQNLQLDQSEASVERYRTALSGWLTELNRIKQNAPATAEAVSALRAQIEAIGNRNTKGILTQEQLANIEKIKNALGDPSKTPNASSVAQWTKDLKEYQKQLDSAGKSTQTFGQKLKQAFSSYTGIALLTKAVHTFIRSLRQMVTEAIKLDDALTQMQIVTRKTDRDIEMFGATMATTAKQIGSSITDLIDSATVFARLGYSDMEAAQLAKLTAMLQNVGDIGVSEAQDAITSIIKAFKIDVDEVEVVMDKLVEVGNNFPISVAQIAEGMNNAGSALATAGNTFEKSVALLTASNTSVQNISKASTGLRTIAARMRKTTRELDDLGELITDSQYDTLIQKLTQYNVQIKDSVTNEFRDTYDVLKDLSAVWSEISDIDKSVITELLAGTRQQNVFGSIMLNFQEAEGAMEAMEDSAGSLRKAYDIFLDSITAHIGKFKAAFQEAAQTLFSSGIITEVIDAGTTILNILNPIFHILSSIVKLLGGLKGVLTVIGGIAIFKRSEQILNFFSKMSTAINGTSNAARGLSIIPKHLAGVATAAQGASKALLAMQASVGILTVILTILISIAQHRKQQREEDAAQAEQAAATAVEEVKTLDKLIAKYEELGKKRATWNDSNRAEASEIQQQILELISNQSGETAKLAAGVDLVNKGYEEQLALLRQIRAESARENSNTLLTELNNELYNYNNAQVGAWKSIANPMSLQNRLGRILTSIGKTSDFFGGHDITSLEANANNARDLLAYYEELQDYLLHNDEWRVFGDAFLGTNSVEIESAVGARISELQTIVREATADAQRYLDNQALVVSYDMQIDTPANTREFDVALDEFVGQLSLQDGIREALESGLITAEDVLSKAREQLAGMFPDIYSEWLKLQSSDVGDAVQTQLETLSAVLDKYNLSGSFQRVEDDVNSLRESLQKLAEDGVLDDETISTLQEKFNIEGLIEDALLAKASGDWSDVERKLRETLLRVPNSVIDSINSMLESGEVDPDSKVATELRSIIDRLRELASIPVDTITTKFQKMTNTVTGAAGAVTSAIGNITGLTNEEFAKLVEYNDKFADAIEFNGMAISLNADKVGEILEEMTEEYIAAIDAQILEDSKRIASLQALDRELTVQEQNEIAGLQRNIQQYRVMRSELLQVTSAYQQWMRAQSTSNPDAMLDDVAKAYQHVNDVLKNTESDVFGKIGTDDFRAALKLLAGDIEDFYDNGIFNADRAIQFVDTISRYLEGEAPGIVNFIEDVVSRGLGSIEGNVFSLADGVSLQDIADQFDIGRDTVVSLIKASEAYGMTTKLAEEEFGRIVQSAQEGRSAIQDMTAATAEYQELLQSAQTGGIDEAAAVEQARNALIAMRDAAQAELTALQSDRALALELDATLDTSALDAEIAERESAIEEVNVALGIENGEETEGQLSAIQDMAEKIAAILDANYELDIRTSASASRLSSVSTQLKNILAQIKNINATPVSVTGSVTTTTSGSSGWVSGGETKKKSSSARASGGEQAAGGWTLTGELGRELYVDPATNSWATVGDHGAEFVDLPPHAIVFDHEQTEKLLHGGKINSRGKAMASGNAAAIGWSGSLDMLWKAAAAANANAGSSSGSGSGSGSGSDVSAEKLKSAFEEAYDLHQHLLAMDQESMEDYLAWLTQAYQDAYAKGEIELDDYRRYQEEVYNGLKDLFDDYMHDMEAEISDISHYDKTGKEILALYRKLLKSIEDELQNAYNAGMKDTDEYVQRLKESFWSYYDAMRDLQDDATDDAKDAVDELIDYRIDMIREELEEEKRALKDRLSYLKDFYDQQKKLLQDSVDEEDYLIEQAEKRKRVTDLELQMEQISLDNSAWAEKRRLELAEELAEAREELRIFERDHAVKMAEDEFDRIYDAQESEIDRETDLVDKQLDDKKQLYESALDDIRNNSMQLYQDMMAYNEKYVDGTTDAVVSMWEEAYKALQEYQALYDEWYKGIELVNATGYVPSDRSNTGPSVSGPNASYAAEAASAATPTASSSAATAPALAVGSYVEVKPGTKWYADSGGGGAWGNARSGTIQYVNENGSHAYNIDGMGWVRKKDIVGYASGTRSATPGLHRINERGFEQVFTAEDGSQYKLFAGGEKVLPAKATDFLFDFAMSGGALLRDAINNTIEAVSVPRGNGGLAGDIHMGDIIIQGNAADRTVSEIRRVQRENIDYVLKEFRKLNK